MNALVIPREKYLELYESMYYTKTMERIIWDLRMSPNSPIPGVVLNSWWEWAIGAGVAAALDPATDYLVPGHRTTAAVTNFFLRNKANFATQYFANHFGSKSSPTKGWDLNVHFGFQEYHIFPFRSDMGINVPVAGGIALALRRLREISGDLSKKQGVAAVFFGEGASNQGLVHGGLRFIAQQNLPVLAVIDKNQWSTYTPAHEEISISDLSDWADGYGLAKLQITSGNDAVHIYRETHTLVERAREESRRQKTLHDRRAGALIVIECERGAPHNVQMDPRRSFRSYTRHQIYAETAAKDDAVELLRRQLLRMPKLKAMEAQNDFRRVKDIQQSDPEFTEEEIRAREEEIDKEINASLEKTLAEGRIDSASSRRNPFPSSAVTIAVPRKEARKVEPLDSFFSGQLDRKEAKQRGWTTRFVDSRRKVVDDAFAKNPLLVAWGQDWGQGDVYGQWMCPSPDSRSLQQKYGSERIFNSILDEGAGTYGSAEGAAFCGLHPIVGTQYMNFGLSGVNALINGIATCYQLYGIRLPITLVLPSGEGISSGHFHAARHLVTFLYHNQMIKVVEPTTVRDVAGLWRAALSDNAPVVIIEGICAYNNVYGADPAEDNFIVPIGKAAIRQKGSDITVLSWGAWTTWMVAEPAVRELTASGISVEWIDARSIVPFDYAAVCDSVAKTRRLAIVCAEGITGSIAESVHSKITTSLFPEGIVPHTKIIAAADGATPQTPEREQVYLPQKQTLIDACRELMGYTGRGGIRLCVLN